MAKGANAALRALLAEVRTELSAVSDAAQQLRYEKKELERLLEEKTEEWTEERVMRISAQSGLVRYMKMNRLGHRIGYDPAEDTGLPAELRALAQLQRTDAVGNPV